MKVAFITDYNNHTGIGAQNYHLFVGLKKQGCDIDIINLVSPQGYKGIPKYGINIISNICNTLYLSFGYGVFYKFPKELERILKEGKYTHVILGHQGLAYLGEKLQTLGFKVTIIIHDLFTLYGDKNGVNEFIYNHFLLNKIDKIKNMVFISEFTKNDYERYYHSLQNHYYSVIYQGIDKQDVNDEVKESLIKHYNLEGKTVIINVGSESPRKNIKTYLEVANHFKDNEDLLFVRIGKPSHESKKYIEEKKLDNVVYCSGISDEELIAWYDIAKIVLSTSTLEGYGRQIFEGYLYDNYIVTSDVSDVKNIFENEGTVLIENDAGKISDYIKGIDVSKKISSRGLIIQNSVGEVSDYIKFLDNL